MERMPMLKHEPGRVLITEAGLYRWLGWAMDIIDSYETRLIEKGDPEHLVHSPIHMQMKAEIRAALAPQCSSCRDGNVAVRGPNGYMWHEFSGDDPEPCMAGEPAPEKAPAPVCPRCSGTGNLPDQVGGIVMGVKACSCVAPAPDLVGELELMGVLRAVVDEASLQTHVRGCDEGMKGAPEKFERAVAWRRAHPKECPGCVAEAALARAKAQPKGEGR